MATTFLSSIEREAHAEGKKEGRKEGKKEGKKEGRAELVLRLIETQCGEPVPASLKKEIQALSSAKLDKLGIAVLEFERLEDVKTWMAK